MPKNHTLSFLNSPACRQIVTKYAEYGSSRAAIAGLLGISIERWKKSKHLDTWFARGASEGVNVASRNVFDKVTSGDIDASKWYLTRADKHLRYLKFDEMEDKVTIDADGGKFNITVKIVD